MKFSEYVLENVSGLNESKDEAIEQLLLLHKVLKQSVKQADGKQKKDVEKMIKVIEFNLVSDKGEPEKLYNIFKKSALKQAKQTNSEKIEEGLTDKLSNAAGVAVDVGHILAHTGVGAAGVLGLAAGAAGSTIAAASLPAIGVAWATSFFTVGAATFIGKQLTASMGGDTLGYRVADKIEKLGKKYDIDSKFEKFKSNVKTTMTKIKSKLKKSKPETSTGGEDGKDGPSTKQSTSSAGSTPAIKEFSQAISKYGWSLESVKNFGDYKTALFFKPTEDGTANSKRGWRQQLDKIFAEVKSAQKDQNIWLTRYWVGGINNEVKNAYIFSVAFGKDPGERPKK